MDTVNIGFKDIRLKKDMLKSRLSWHAFLPFQVYVQTWGLMFPRYKFVVDGSPTSWEPGAQSSKTADTEKRKEFPVAVWQN